MCNGVAAKMCVKSVVFLIGILFNFHIIKTQTPPRVPQIFPPTQPTFVQTQQPNEMPLSLQALYTGCPESNGNRENCKTKLMNILNFLLERETGERRKIDSSKILQAKEMLKNDNKKLIMDATKNAIEHILTRNYQYQAVSNNVLRLSLGKSITNPAIQPRLNCRNNVPMRRVNGPKYATHSSTHLVQSQPKLMQTPSNYINSLPMGYSVEPILASVNINPVIPVTSVTGQVGDNDHVLVFYKPKVVTYNQLYGNVVKKLSKRILVPYYVSKLN